MSNEVVEQPELRRVWITHYADGSISHHWLDEPRKYDPERDQQQFTSVEFARVSTSADATQRITIKEACQAALADVERAQEARRAYSLAEQAQEAVAIAPGSTSADYIRGIEDAAKIAERHFDDDPSLDCDGGTDCVKNIATSIRALLPSGVVFKRQ